MRVFRSYSAFSIVASSALLVSASNFAQGQESGNILLGYAGSRASAAETPSGKHKIIAQPSKKENLALVPLASAHTGVDPEAKDDTTLFDVEAASLGSQVVLAPQAQDIAKDPEEDGGVKIYTVASGDTLGSIAAAHSITINTILWANDLENADEIKPGDQIFILPVAGLSHVVKGGESLEDIAKEFQADKEKIIAFNSLPANGELKSGDTIIIPDGRKKEEEQESSTQNDGLERRQYATSTGGTAVDISSSVPKGRAGAGHRFPYGYCTWYVAQKRYIPWGGNAGTWLYNAKAMGYRTGKAPAVGSIVVTTENRYYGHVAIVEKVSGGTITVSEMNYSGWGKTTRRTLAASSRVIKGYIY